MPCLRDLDKPVIHLRLIRNLIASMVSDARYRKGGVGDGDFYLPGFNMPKGKFAAYGNSHMEDQVVMNMTTYISKKNLDNIVAR